MHRFVNNSNKDSDNMLYYVSLQRNTVISNPREKLAVTNTLVFITRILSEAVSTDVSDSL